MISRLRSVTKTQFVTFSVFRSVTPESLMWRGIWGFRYFSTFLAGNAANPYVARLTAELLP